MTSMLALACPPRCQHHDSISGDESHHATLLDDQQVRVSVCTWRNAEGSTGHDLCLELTGPLGGEVFLSGDGARRLADVLREAARLTEA